TGDHPGVVEEGSGKQRHVGNIARLVLCRVEHLPLPRRLGVDRGSAAAGSFRLTVIPAVIELEPLLTERNRAVETPVLGGSTIATGLIPGNFRHVGQGRSSHHTWRGGKVLAGGAIKHVSRVRAAHGGHVRRGG